MTTITYEPHEWVEPPSYRRVFWAVLRGYVLALVTLGIPYIVLAVLGLVGSQQSVQRPGPFPLTGAWSLDADLVVAALVVLVAAYWIRRQVRDAAWRPVSLPVVAGVVALTGYAPALAMRPFQLSGVVALPLSAWLVQRFAVDREHRFRIPVKAAVAVALVGFAVLASYLVYHPLSIDGVGSGSDGSGNTFQRLDVRNAGFSSVRILSIGGAGLVKAPFGDGLLPPATVHGRGHAVFYLRGDPCGVRTVTVRFEVMGRSSSRPFDVLGRACD